MMEAGTWATRTDPPEGGEKLLVKGKIKGFHGEGVWGGGGWVVVGREERGKSGGKWGQEEGKKMGEFCRRGDWEVNEREPKREDPHSSKTNFLKSTKQKGVLVDFQV